MSLTEAEQLYIESSWLHWVTVIEGFETAVYNIAGMRCK